MKLRRQRGVTLLVTMLLLVGVLLLGASAARMALLGEKAARAERDRFIAFQAAEDALMDAQHDIDSGDEAIGLPPDGGLPAWLKLDLAGSATTPFGAATGATMETGQGVLPFQRPRYLVERLPFGPPGAEGAPARYVYRVTAIGFGNRKDTEVVLQMRYRRHEPADPPAGRLSWREISNWRELHQSAHP